MKDFLLHNLARNMSLYNTGQAISVEIGLLMTSDSSVGMYYNILFSLRVDFLSIISEFPG